MKYGGKEKKDPFCGDMLKFQVKDDKEFHWSRAYHWYSDMHVEYVSSKSRRTIGLVQVGCMPEVFNVP